MIDEIADYTTENQYHQRRLLMSIEASYGELNLLICVCDNPYYRDEIVRDYEAKLSTKGVVCHRVQIDRHQPSLKQSLLDLNTLDLNTNYDREHPAIVTVFGIDGLLDIRSERDRSSSPTTNRSEREKFFFSAQWTREALREFRFPIVLWMTDAIASELSRQAPDFWSWRGGVFEFVRPLAAIAGDFDREEMLDTNDFNTSESSANPEEIQAQIDKLSATNPNSPLLRSLYLSLANAYYDRYFQNRSARNNEHLENAISIYQRALTLFSREAFPEDWASAQDKLGNAYSRRIQGKRADNLELAIEHYQLALQVFTREAFPKEWARNKGNLGNAYRERIRGKGAENLELAIECYQLALQVFTCEDFPEDWASIQGNFGNAYRKRIRGERADNLELALEYYQLALQVFTRDAFPENWAITKRNLGIAQKDRLQEQQAASLSK
jgi:tetratricopeptide (TPR) repeat protein